MSSTRSLFSTTCLTAALLCAAPNAALANPQGGVVTAGQASISEAGKKLDVIQQSQKAVIDWRGFDIAPDEHTQFHQPGSSSIALNRVNRTSASIINGQLTANGNVVIVNQNGLLFGQNAKVDVNGLVATTADIDNDTFMHNDVLAFDKPGKADAAVVNAGQITAKDAGLVGLVAPNVVNSGIITAKLGRVHLASGDTATVDMYGDGLMNVAVSDAVKSQLVSNNGIIQADGGKIALTAAAGNHIVNSLIAQSGALQARSVGMKNGEIIIAAVGSNAVAGNVAADKGRKQGASTVLNSGVLDASGRNAGERGGKVTVTGDHVALLDGTLIDASGHTGKSGTTTGQLKSAKREGSAGGEILIGGDYLGQGDTATAKNLYVDRGALILNDALNTGDAGRTIFWGDDTTQFYGNVYARALGGKEINALTWNATSGGNEGNGGFVETSGYKHLDAGGYVDLTSSNGARGTYFLDPTDITIYGNVDPSFISTDSSINLASSLRLWLDASDTANVNLTYNSLGTTATGTSGSNTITVSANTDLAVGARIRLGSAGSVTAASTLGADTYTITSISGTTITLSSNLTTDYNVGLGNNGIYQGYVSQLSDKSGQVNHATQATAANMPLWISNGQNGLGTASFDGVNDFLSANLYLSALGNNLTFNVSTSPTTTGSANPLLFWRGNATGLAQGYLDTSKWGYSWQNIPNSYEWTGGPAISVGNSQIVSLLISPTQANLSVNGGTSSINSISHGVENDSSTPLRIGIDQCCGRWYNGKLEDTIIYNTVLATNAQALVNQYQSAKWGIALTPPGSGATEAAMATASIQKGDGADGYSVFTTRYLERLSQSADISLQASNNINLDFKGDTLNFSTANRSLTLTAGNQITTASAGTITTNGGNISLTGTTGGIIFNNAFALNSNGGTIALNNATTLNASLTTNSGSGTTNFGSTVNGANGLTATAGTFNFASALGGTTPLGPVNLTSANALSLPSITASSITASTTTGNITGSGRLATTGGNLNLTAGTDLDLSAIGIETNHGNATLGGRDVTLNTWINTGTGNFTVNASRDIFLTRNNLTSGLVGYWNFDEGSGTTALDSAGSNNGTLTNGPTYSASTPHGSGYSLSFDGVDDWVSLVKPATLTNQITISLWAKWTTVGTTTGTIQALVDNDHSSAPNKGFVIQDRPDLSKHLTFGTNPSSNGTETSTIVGDGTWRFISATNDGVTSSIYIDGVLNNSVAETPNNNYQANMAFGRWLGGGRYLNGFLDDVRIYNTALTATQVSQLYAPQVAWNTGTTSLTAGRDVAFNLGGDTLTVGSGKNISVAATGSISSASAGTISATKNAGVGGDITMTAGGSSTIDVSALTLNASTGGAVSITSPGAMTLGTINAGSIVARTTGASADLTIPSGKVLTATGTGTPLTLVAGRNFINNAGSGALSAASGRWLVYSTNLANDTIGSLSNSFRRFTCSYGGACPTLGSGNGLLYSYTPTLTATPSALSSLTYGDAVPSFSGYSYALSGYLGSDSGSDTITGSLNGSSTYSQGSNVGSYNIDYSSGALASAMGYGFSYANNASAITVATRALSVTADAKSKSFGAADPALTYTLTSGALYGSDVFSGALSRAAGESVAGSPYAINQNTLSAGSNYMISYNPGIFTIIAAAISPTNALPNTVARVSQVPEINMPAFAQSETAWMSSDARVPEKPQPNSNAPVSNHSLHADAKKEGAAFTTKASSQSLKTLRRWLRIEPALAKRFDLDADQNVEF